MSIADIKGDRSEAAEPEVYSFTFTLSGVTEITDQLANALFASGCTDSFLHSTGGIVLLDFDREANALREAIETALRDVESCGLGIRVTHVAPPDEDTLEDFNAWLRLRDKPQMPVLPSPGAH